MGSWLDLHESFGHIICSSIIVVVVAIMSSIEGIKHSEGRKCPTEDGEDCPTPKNISSVARILFEYFSY